MTMKIRAGVLGLTAVGLLAAGAGAQSPMFRGDPARTGAYPDAGPASGAVLAWTLEVGGAVRSSPAVTDEALYVGSSDGTLHAVDLDGHPLWRYDAGGPVLSSPAVADGIVVVATREGALHAVDAGGGEVIWATPPSSWDPLPWGWDYLSPSPAIVDDIVVAAWPDGTVRGLALRDGRPLWQSDLGARIRSSPAVSGGRVLIGDDAGRVHALALADGAPIWEHATEGAGRRSEEWGYDRTTVQASPAARDGRVIIGSRDGGLYALDLARGTRLWRVDYGAPWVVASAAVGPEAAYIGSSDGRFVQAVEAATGRELWRTDVGTRVFASPALTDAALYVADHRGRVRALDPATGAELWSLQLASQIQSSPVPHGDQLYVGTDDGEVVALRRAAAPPRMAVFWDSALSHLAVRPGGPRLRDYLADHGFEVLDATGLAGWLRAGMERPAGSVVVFALDQVPAGVGPTAGDSIGTLARYLRAGGKVVWTGFPPWGLVRDSTGAPTGLDLERHRALGIDLSQSLTGDYGAVPTEAGRRWGLSTVQLASLVVRAAEGVTPLARDDLGRIAAAVRSWGGAPGSGLVVLWGLGAPWSALEAIRAVAEYGVLRPPDG